MSKQIFIYSVFCCFLLFQARGQETSLYGYEVKKPLVIDQSLINYETSNHLNIFKTEKAVNSGHIFISQLKIKSDEIEEIKFFDDNKASYWLLLTFHLPQDSSSDIVFSLPGGQQDSLWVLDKNLNVTQAHKIPYKNFRIDHTEKIASADPRGLGLHLTHKESYILTHLKTYRYGAMQIPRISSAEKYEPWFFRKMLFTTLFFLFITGLEVGMILYYLLQYVVLRHKYLIYYILYVAFQMLPNLDYFLWTFSDAVPVPYSWFNFKVFHLVSIILSYVLFLKSFFDQKLRLLELSYKLMLPLTVTLFVIDLFLLNKGNEFLSYQFYAYFRSFASLFCLLMTIAIAFVYKLRNYYLLIFGILCIVITEIIGWFFFGEIRSVIINMGIILEYLCFSHLINLKMRDQETERKKLKIENIELIHQQQNMKTSLAQDIHDEIGSAITKLNLEMHLDKSKSEIKGLNQTIEKYQRHLSKVSEGLRELVNVIDDKTEDYLNLASSLRLIASDYLANTSVKLEFVKEDNGQNFEVQKSVKRNLLAILKESLQNILKHSHAQHVIIKLGFDGEWLLFEIKDDGIGMKLDLEMIPGTGLKNIVQRSKKINGKINLISEQTHGTTVSLKIHRDELLV